MSYGNQTTVTGHNSAEDSGNQSQKPGGGGKKRRSVVLSVALRIVEAITALSFSNTYKGSSDSEGVAEGRTSVEKRWKI